MSSFENMKNALNGESDRGAVLIAASMIDLALEKLLKAKLIQSPTKQDQLFDNNGALGTFSAKIELAYRIGIITKSQKLMFNTFRGIRNEFAHSPLSLSLDKPSIKDKLFAAVEHNPNIRDMYYDRLKKEAVNQGLSGEFVEKSQKSPRDMLEIIFVLEISLLELALGKITRLTEA